MMKQIMKALGLVLLLAGSGIVLAEEPGPPPGLVPITAERLMQVTSIDAPARTIYLDGTRYRVSRDVELRLISGETVGLSELSRVRVGMQVSPTMIGKEGTLPMIKEMWVFE